MIKHFIICGIGTYNWVKFGVVFWVGFLKVFLGIHLGVSALLITKDPRIDGHRE